MTPRKPIIVFLLAPPSRAFVSARRRRPRRPAYPLVIRGSGHVSAAAALRRARQWRREGWTCWIARLPRAAMNPMLEPLGGW